MLVYRTVVSHSQIFITPVYTLSHEGGRGRFVFSFSQVVRKYNEIDSSGLAMST